MTHRHSNGEFIIGVRGTVQAGNILNSAHVLYVCGQECVGYCPIKSPELLVNYSYDFVEVLLFQSPQTPTNPVPIKMALPKCHAHSREIRPPSLTTQLGTDHLDEPIGSSL